MHEIKFFFSQPNWDALLDSLYVDGEEERLLASIEIDGEPYDSVGIRYKGFSSVSVDRKKNPFNVKLDYVRDQDHNGIDKLKLSNVIQDPSFIRESLSYEIARKYMPASGANYARLYINGEYWGLYSNVQNVGKDFLRTHFGSAENAFVKANPESLDLNGENCNLSNNPGNDSTDYYALYEMRSDFGYADLYKLIDVLNTDIDNIEEVLNVDRTLWMHAFNYVLVNFDSYIGYAQNYYLYKGLNGQFNPIVWDLNQSFGSFRLTDASDYYRGFNTEEAAFMDPLAHYHSTSVYPRPLMRNLFNNGRYRKMYLAHIRTINQENFENTYYKDRAEALQNTIDGDVQEDQNKFYSYEDFLKNRDHSVTYLVDYPGITDLMDARSTYLSGYSGYSGEPTIHQVSDSVSENSIFITAEVADATEVFLAYRTNSTSRFQLVPMFDDGVHNDGSIGDEVYGIELSDQRTLQYYIYCENSDAGSFSPARAAYEFYSIDTVRHIAINEICPSNSSILVDAEGDYDDWVELYNNTGQDISLGGYHLSDDRTLPMKWQFPDTLIKANDYLLIWADGDTDGKGLHASFKLSASGEAVVLSDTTGRVIDEVLFGAIETDVTVGRSPNGTGDYHLMNPTPGARNEDIFEANPRDTSDDVYVHVYPNPASSYFILELEKAGRYDMQLTDLSGKILKDKSGYFSTTRVDVRDLLPGVYILHLINSENSYSIRLIKR